MNKLEMQINKIIDFDIEKKNSFDSMEEIEKIEQKFSIVLPEEYKDFLFKYAGCYIKDDYFYKPIEINPMSSPNGYSSTGYFYGNDIVSAINTYFESELESRLVPICEADGGDLICIDISEKYYGSIYYWPHDTNGVLDDSLFLVQKSFEDFILSFERHKSKDTAVDLDKIKINLDPSLL